MATSTMTSQPVPDPLSAPNSNNTSLNLPHSNSMPTSTSTSTPPNKTLSVLEEVEAAQDRLRSRLAGALTSPPPNIPHDALPSVPLIDIGPSFDGTLESRKKVASQIRDACLTTGFFQISNHGVTPGAMASVLKQAERFFHDLAEPKRQALHIKHSTLFRGYEPHDSTYVNPDDQNNSNDNNNNNSNSSSDNSSSSSNTYDTAEQQQQQQETKEGFNWGYEEALDPTGGDGRYVELDGSKPDPARGHGNVWPAEEDLPGFKAAIAEYYGQVLQLARHLFRLFALSLGLEERYFDELMTHPGGIARLLYYAGQPVIEDEKTDRGMNDATTTTNTTTVTAKKEEQEHTTKLGLGAHTDYECFTLLLSSANPGLEILFPPSPGTAGNPIWRPCPVRPGTLTVNVADFLMRWTNGLYKSTIHRVVSKPGAGERYSVPFFFSINYDGEVAPLPEWCVGESHFRPLKAGEYVLERLRATQILEDQEKEEQNRTK
ncbi:hypothetical protein A1O1_08522 [Capronia coronata CBS 617.96]|uniref:Fe2OG dioxygenase domain-containing protein n=1 Tax=Capronia coronata CBS 617.96 TaxID=1182541 RepID=W9XJM9_9EURO|nr:uncharacterized protein A1O1_08522 [Capronia coronata CBS 617.96]EXJ80378.1 hypothetical protein A1O1_08522 [Capronia coronata CBS 617.96]